MRTEEFDKAIKTVTQERGEVYGSALHNLERCSKGWDMISACEDPATRAALFYIWGKMVRLISNPEHLDSMIDIAGYARTICMAQDERSEEEAKEFWKTHD